MIETFRANPHHVFDKIIFNYNFKRLFRLIFDNFWQVLSLFPVSFPTSLKLIV